VDFQQHDEDDVKKVGEVEIESEEEDEDESEEEEEFDDDFM
jgi:hypothetical protein